MTVSTPTNDQILAAASNAPSAVEAALALGMPRSTFRRRLAAAQVEAEAAENARITAILAEQAAAEAATPAPTQAERLAAARVEFDALRTWEAGDQTTDRPATPNYDLLDPSRKSNRKATASTSTRTPRAGGHRFTIDGVVVTDGYQGLGSLAWHAASLGIGPDRMNAKALRVLLAEAGVADPNATGWEVTLAGGVRRLGAIATTEMENAR